MGTKARAAIVVVCALAAISLAPAARAAAPQLIGNVKDPQQIAVDGNNVFWTDGRKVVRVDATTGLGQAVYSARRNTMVTGLNAGGGTMAFAVVQTGRKTAISHAYIYLAATGELRAVAYGKARLKKGSIVCGALATVGRVSDGGEALVVKSTYSLSRKICRHRLDITSQVTAANAGGSRQLFAGDLAIPGNLLRKLTDIIDADLVGNSLLLTGDGVGVLDLASRQFVLIATGRSGYVRDGEFDQSGNVLLTSVKVAHTRTFPVTSTLFSAESGFNAQTLLAANTPGVIYHACGKYLSRGKFQMHQGDTSALDIVPSPLVPETLTGSSPLPLAAREFWGSGCDAANVAFAVNDPAGTSQLLYFAPLAG